VLRASPANAISVAAQVHFLFFFPHHKIFITGLCRFFPLRSLSTLQQNLSYHSAKPYPIFRGSKSALSRKIDSAQTLPPTPSSFMSSRCPHVSQRTPLLPFDTLLFPFFCSSLLDPLSLLSCKRTNSATEPAEEKCPYQAATFNTVALKSARSGSSKIKSTTVFPQLVLHQRFGCGQPISVNMAPHSRRPLHTGYSRQRQLWVHSLPLRPVFSGFFPTPRFVRVFQTRPPKFHGFGLNHCSNLAALGYVQPSPWHNSERQKAVTCGCFFLVVFVFFIWVSVCLYMLLPPFFLPSFPCPSLPTPLHHCLLLSFPPSTPFLRPSPPSVQGGWGFFPFLAPPSALSFRLQSFHNRRLASFLNG